MLYKQAISVALLNALTRLMKAEELNDFRLVGGTALALQLGHRLSIDIDLFTDNSNIDILAIENKFKTLGIYKFRNDERSLNNRLNNSLFYYENVRIDLYKWERKFTEPAVSHDGVRMATLTDISILKLDALKDRIHKKDFIDLYFLFGKLGGLNAVSNYLKVTKSETANEVANKLSRVRGAMNNKTPMPQMLISFDELTLEQSFDQLISEIKNQNKSGFSL